MHATSTTCRSQHVHSLSNHKLIISIYWQGGLLPASDLSRWATVRWATVRHSIFSLQNHAPWREGFAGEGGPQEAHARALMRRPPLLMRLGSEEAADGHFMIKLKALKVTMVG